MQDHEKIRERAFEIWDREGRQDGRADEHWSQAERELGAPEAGWAKRAPYQTLPLPHQRFRSTPSACSNMVLEG